MQESQSKAKSTASDMDSSSNDKFKRRFLKVILDVCPEFKFDSTNRAIVADLYRWATMQPGNLDLNKGLWLCGSIGSGKTTLLHILHKFGLEYNFRKPQTFEITNCKTVVADFSQEGYKGIQRYIDYAGQAFDELGSETIPGGHFHMTENVMQYLLECRYDNRRKCITHVTTNFSDDDVLKTYGLRVFDRRREMFNIIELSSPTHRKKNS